jgi:hypothetical protein
MFDYLPRETLKKLMPSMLVNEITAEYDRLAKEAVIAAVKDKCNKTIIIKNMDDFINGLNDLRKAGYMIKFETKEILYAGSYRSKGEFNVYKIQGGTVL